MVRRKNHFSVVLVLVLALGLVWIGGSIFRSWQTRDWFGVEPYRMLILHGKKGTEPEAIELISIWPGIRKVTSLSIPPGLTIPTVGGYGNYRLGAQVELGRVEGVGDELLRDSVGFVLGVPIHRILWQQKPVFERWNAIRVTIQAGLTGKMSLPEAIDLTRLFFWLKPASFEQLSLSQTNVVRSLTEADGSVALYPERALLVRYMIDHFSTMWKEAALTQVAVINASGKPQMASQWSLYALVGGYDVVSIADEPAVQAKTRIIFSSKQTAQSVVGKALVALYPGVMVEIGDTSSYRSRVAVVLGLDSWSYLTDRATYLHKAR